MNARNEQATGRWAHTPDGRHPGLWDEGLNGVEFTVHDVYYFESSFEYQLPFNCRDRVELDFDWWSLNPEPLLKKDQRCRDSLSHC
jgi:hypothetical protein